MTSVQICTTPNTGEGYQSANESTINDLLVEINGWLREMAYQLALRNESGQ